MGFFVVNNGDLPNCVQVQQLRCNICFPHVVMFIVKRFFTLSTCENVWMWKLDPKLVFPFERTFLAMFAHCLEVHV
jgi:hypothetical protein